MCPFRSSIYRSEYQKQIAPSVPFVEESQRAPSKDANFVGRRPHWWQRLVGKRIAAEAAPRGPASPLSGA